LAREILGTRTQIVNWHGRYTEWADALDELREVLGGSSSLDDPAVAVAGFGQRRAFSEILVPGPSGIALTGKSRDEALASISLAGLRAAAADPANVSARLWAHYVIDGMSMEHAVETLQQAGVEDLGNAEDPRTFKRTTWLAGLGTLDFYPAKRARDLQALLRHLEEALDRLLDTSLALPMPRALASKRVRPDAPFVGREVERRTLHAAWDAVEGGDHAVVLVYAGAGMGKSELVYEFASTVREVATIVASEPSRSYNQPHAQVDELLKQLLDLASSIDPALPQLSEAGRRAIRRRFPDWWPPGEDTPTATSDTPSPPAVLGDDKQALHEATAALVEVVAARRPLVVVVEDLHDAEDDSLLAILSLIEERKARVLIVLTLRATSGPRSERIADLVAGSAGRAGPFDIILLEELPKEDLVELVDAVYNGSDRAELATRLFARTHGQPLYATSLLQSALRQTAGAAAELLKKLGPPADLAAYIRLRRAELRELEQRALEAASVIGRSFDLDLLARVLGESHTEVVAVIDALDDCGFVAQADRAGRAQFRHPLLREAVYRGTKKSTRANLHRAAAHALGSGTTPEQVSSYERHCRKASALHMEMHPLAVEAALLVAQNSVNRLAYAHAARTCQNAIAFAHTPSERARLLAQLGDAVWRWGDLQQARDHLQRAAGEARKVPPPDGVEVLASIAATLSVVSYQSNGSDPDMLALYEGALNLLPAEEVFWRVRLRTALAREAPTLFATRDLPEITQTTIDQAEQSGDPATQAYGRLLRSEVLLDELDPRPRIGVAKELVAAAEAAEDPYLLTIGHAVGLQAGLESLDRPTVDRSLEAVQAVATRFRFKFAQWHADALTAGRALYQLPLDHAAAAIERARETGPLGYGEVDLLYLVQWGFLMRELGRISDTEDFVRDGATKLKLLAWKAALACGLCEVDSGSRADEAAPLLAEFEEKGLDRLRRDGTYPLTLSFLAQAYAYRRDQVNAGKLLPVITACLGRHPATVPSTYWGSMDYYKGLLHATCEDFDTALSCFDRALEHDERIGSPLWRCHTLVARSQARRARQGATDSGAAHDEAEARAIADRNGYLRALQELDREHPQLIEAPAPA
jgi:tetratricopeptide (TPR) repeat protein